MFWLLEQQPCVYHFRLSLNWEEVFEGTENCSGRDSWVIPEPFRTVEGYNQGRSSMLEERQGLIKVCLLAVWKEDRHLKLVHKVG